MLSHRSRLLAGMCCGWLAAAAAQAADQVGSAPPKTQQETMAERGYVRYRGAWRTAQEIELLERTERAQLARAEWKTRIERLRKQLDQPAHAERAAEELAEIVDPAAVPALAAAVAAEPQFRVRSLALDSLARIRAAEATVALVGIAVDHPDSETRIAAVERLATTAPQAAVPGLVAALAGPDNARINRAAEAIGRLRAALPPDSPLSRDDALLGRLIDTLQTEHLSVGGEGGEGSMNVTFTPSGGGLSLGGGPKRVRSIVRNQDVLATLAAATGVDFGWDVAAWRAWLATRSAPADLDLRRSR